MIIGTFNQVGSSYSGTIQTLSFMTKAVFEPADKKQDRSPDYRITNGHTEIGAAWKETSEAGNPYLSVRLEDPALPATIYCALVKAAEQSDYSLVWERKRKRD